MSFMGGGGRVVLERDEKGKCDLELEYTVYQIFLKFTKITIFLLLFVKNTKWTKNNMLDSLYPKYEE